MWSGNYIRVEGPVDISIVGMETSAEGNTKVLIARKLSITRLFGWCNEPLETFCYSKPRRQSPRLTGSSESSQPKRAVAGVGFAGSAFWRTEYS